ncbi:hypothetical protein HDE79_002097 [Rhodanobacter sp. MP1X3]|nr:hypothetical protein [Rhodanobacter sp. MP1X3]
MSINRVIWLNQSRWNKRHIDKKPGVNLELKIYPGCLLITARGFEHCRGEVFSDALSPILRDKFLETKHAESRRMHGTEMLASPSRFLGEMPAKLIDEVRPPRAGQPYDLRRRFAGTSTAEEEPLRQCHQPPAS